MIITLTRCWNIYDILEIPGFKEGLVIKEFVSKLFDIYNSEEMKSVCKVLFQKMRNKFFLNFSFNTFDVVCNFFKIVNCSGGIPYFAPWIRDHEKTDCQVFARYLV